MKPNIPIIFLAGALASLPSRADTVFSWETGLEGWNGTGAVSTIGATDGLQSLAVTTPMSSMWYSTPVSTDLDEATRHVLFTGATELKLDVSYPNPGYNSWYADPSVELIIQGDGVPWTTLGTRTVPIGGAPQTFSWDLTIGQAASLAAGPWAQVIMKFTYGNGGSTGTDAVFYVDKLASTVVIVAPPTSNYFWKGNVSGSWAALNWATDATGATAAPALTTNGTAGVAFATADATNLATTLGANQNILSMVVSGSTPEVGISGTHNLTIGADGILIEANAGPVNIDTTGQIVLSSDQLWTNNSSAQFTVSSKISGAHELTIGGSGTTFLTEANAHTVGTKVQQGTLVIGDPLSLGPVTSPLTVSGGRLDLNGISPTVGGLAGSLGGIVTNLVTEPATLTIADDVGSIYNGAINDGPGQVSVVKKGSGTLTLGGGGSFTGNMVIQDGLVTANSSIFGPPVTSNFGNAQVPGRTITVESAGSVLLNTNNVLSNQLGDVTALPTFVINGGTLDATRYNLIGGVTLNGGVLSQMSSDSGSYEGYQFKGEIHAIGTQLSVITSGNGRGNHLSDETIFDVVNVTINADPDLVVSTPLLNQSGDFGSAPGGLTKKGAGTLSLEGVNNYSGPTKVLEGTLSLTNASLGDLSAVELSAGAKLDLNFSDVDTIGSFTVNGVAKPAGFYGAIGSGAAHELAQITGLGLLSVTPDAYASWIAGYPSLSGADTAKTADPDHDGMTNLQEFAFNGNPASSIASGKMRSRVETVGTGQALVITIPVRDEAVLSGTAPAMLSSTGFSYRIGGSNNLATFDQNVSEVIPALTGTPTLPTLDAGWSYRTFRLDGNIGGATPRGPKGFLQATAIAPN